MRYLFTALILVIFFQNICAQDHSWFYEEHEKYKEINIYDRFFKHADIEPMVQSLDLHPGFEVSSVGKSIEGKGIHLVKWGHGPEKILMWTQMHGNEPTATMAVMDIFNFLKSEDHAEFKRDLAERVTLLFIPMLNPDGAEVYKRRNAIDVDLNRDARRLQSPESKILKSVRDQYNPHFGFNLHDQSLYYGAGNSGNPVAIAFLAPAYNWEKEVNEVRLNAMKLIAQLNEIMQEYVPGKVAKFNDTFEPRAFGDNIQKWGTSTILIESGGLLDDPEKQYLRKLHFVMLMSSFVSIANGDYQNYGRNAYEAIPMNRISIFDLLIKEVEVITENNTFILDLGYRNQAVFSDGPRSTMQDQSQLEDVGDLASFSGYQVFNASGYQIRRAKLYGRIFENLEELINTNWFELIKLGYGHFRVKKEVHGDLESILPFRILKHDESLPEFPAIGENAALLMEKDGRIRYLIANGKMHDLDNFKKE